MLTKPVFIFIFSDCTGGVASFNRNLINHTSRNEECRTRVILLRAEEDNRVAFSDFLRAERVTQFRYSSAENQYYVLRRLFHELGKEPGCIITDNALVLNAISLFGRFKRVVFLVHDYFYINWALGYSNMIDAAIAHSSFFRDILLAADMKRFQEKAFYIPYGVELPDPAWKKRPAGEQLKLIFLGRLVEEKGVKLLKQIDEIIREGGGMVTWTIVGSGPLLPFLKDQWGNAGNVAFVQAKDGNEVYGLLGDHDILVFPSQFEGTPVSIMEALSRGAVPVVSDLPGGTRDMVQPATGFLCNTMDAGDYARAVLQLDSDRILLENMQAAAVNRAKNAYDINKAADNYFSFFFRQTELPLQELNGSKVKLSRLDSPLLPNTVVKAFRQMRKKMRL